MPWTIHAVSELPIVETQYWGVISDDQLSSAVRASLSVARNLGLRLFLTDCTLLVGGHEVFDLYGLTSDIGSYGWESPLREAIVVPGEDEFSALSRFWNIICVNRGFRVAVFRDREAAVSWLLETLQQETV